MVMLTTTGRLLIIAGLVMLSFAVYFVMSIGLRMRQQIKVASTRAHLVAYQCAATNYFNRIGRWPQSAQELVSNSAGIIFIYPGPPWADAWGNPVIFTPFSRVHGSGSILSYGRDGKPGGTGTDADIEMKFP
jgi:hypothetical protein